MEYKHIPVMLDEVVTSLKPQEGQVIIDCTLGGGGYTLALAKLVGKTGRVLSIDLDEMALANARRLFSENKVDNIILAQGNFREIKEIATENLGSEVLVDGIVMDLGFSSAQLEDDNRGMSFMVDKPLDMSFAADGVTTKKIVNKWKEKELTRIFREYGEERFASRVAKFICEARRIKPIETTGELVAVIEKAIPASNRHSQGIHFATRVFQALRIETNDELGALREVLPQAAGLLKSGGRLVVVSFHSLEDRIVKQFMKREATDCTCPPKQFVCNCNHEASLEILTKKPLEASEPELAANPRSRSAKLRAAKKI